MRYLFLMLLTFSTQASPHWKQYVNITNNCLESRDRNLVKKYDRKLRNCRLSYQYKKLSLIHI